TTTSAWRAVRPKFSSRILGVHSGAPSSTSTSSVSSTASAAPLIGASHTLASGRIRHRRTYTNLPHKPTVPTPPANACSASWTRPGGRVPPPSSSRFYLLKVELSARGTASTRYLPAPRSTFLHATQSFPL